ncbi:MAG: NUDIX hydrolase [Acidobacteria bacterium]|nr:NUDIX hydrolase [Acidobacteriota bacterium]MCB9396953.1 NUDIX hydrolase [Acidobacteriota bacterium]
MKIRCSALILRHNKLLFLQYNYAGGPVYCLPGGGLNPGETLTQALARELLEELGFEDPRIGPLTFATEVLDAPNLMPTLHLVFSVEVQGEPQVNPAETKADGWIWLDRESLEQEALYPPINAAIQTWLAGSPLPCYLGPAPKRIWK